MNMPMEAAHARVFHPNADHVSRLQPSGAGDMRTPAAIALRMAFRQRVCHSPITRLARPRSATATRLANSIDLRDEVFEFLHACRDVSPAS
jgi:epoxyqueuosine reductase QueG